MSTTHSISKKDHYDTYRPSRHARHLESEGYLRPDQMAKAIFFEYIDDFKKPTIRSVVHRRLVKETRKNNKLTSQISANTQGDEKICRSPPPHIATSEKIVANANNEVESRVDRCMRKMHNLESQLKGVGVKDLISEEEQLLASHLPGSPRKYHGPRRMSAVEIIDRRKRKADQVKNAMKDDTNDKAWQLKQQEKAEKKRLGLERREKCYMCQLEFPKGTCKFRVVEKCIHEWRMLQKAVRRVKKKIRHLIQNLGDGGAAHVFRMAARISAEETIADNESRNANRAIKPNTHSYQRTRHNTSGPALGINVSPQRPDSAPDGGTKSPRAHLRTMHHFKSLNEGSPDRGIRRSTSPLQRARRSTMHILKSRRDAAEVRMRRSTAPLQKACLVKLSTTPGNISYDQFFSGLYRIFGLRVDSEQVRRELVAWLDRDGGGDISFTEFCALTDSIEHAGKKRKGLYYAAVPGSDKHPEVTLEALDETQQEMLDIPSRLVHTLYEKKRVCSFCMQILYAKTFGKDGSGGVKGFGNTESYRWAHGITFNDLCTQAGSAGWSPRVMPVSMITTHTPHNWQKVTDDICESMATRRALAPFETWNEHCVRGPFAKHYISFNHVPTPKSTYGRKPCTKQECLCSENDTAKASPEGASHSRFKNQISKELEGIYAQYRSSGAKSLEHFEMSREFRESEKAFYKLHKKEITMATRKRRKAVMATSNEMNEAAAKLQAVMRGRQARKLEIEKRDKAAAEAKAKLDAKRKEMQKRITEFNGKMSSFHKLHALQKGQLMKRRTAVMRKKEEIGMV